VITHVEPVAAGGAAPGKLLVRGTTSDNGPVKKVVVNGLEAKPTADNFSQWEIVLDGPAARAVKITASAEDAAGNVEKLPHTWARLR
jgi:pyocin large subunit-like protein